MSFPGWGSLSTPVRSTALVLTTATCAILAACTSPPITSPTPIAISGVTNERVPFRAAITDWTDGLQTAKVVPADTTGIDLTNPETEAIAPDRADPNALYIAWVGLPCQDRPRLAISKSDVGLVVELDKGPEHANQACPFYPDYFAVRLTFGKAIAFDQARLDVAE
jgi:hypothetical protein